MRVLTFNIFIFLIIFMMSCRNNIRLENELYCDFEKFDTVAGLIKTNYKAFTINKLHSVISEKNVHSGKYSLALLPGPKKAFKLEIPGIIADQIYEIVLWKKRSPDSLSFEIKETGSKKAFTIKQIHNKNGETYDWEKLDLKFTIPPYLNSGEMTMTVVNSGRDTIYIDDLTIINHSYKVYPKFPHEQTLYIYVDTFGINQLNDQRKKIFLSEADFTGSPDYVNTILFFRGVASNGRLRLRGNNADHIKGGKWSMRIDMGKKAWNSLSEFSIYNPRLRKNTDEIFVHWWMRQEGLLATRMGLVPVSFNGKSIGIMAWEEDFDSEFPVINNRPEGVIFKPSDRIKSVINPHSGDENKNDLFFISSEADFYAIKKLRKRAGFFNNCLNARNLFYQFKNNLQPAGDMFDIQQLAKFIAIVDITRSWHVLRWDNLRFYFNPLCEKIEFIAHDCSPGLIKLKDNQYILAGATETAEGLLGIPLNFLSDMEFQRYYLLYLRRYAASGYIDSLTRRYAADLAEQTALLKAEKSDFVSGIPQMIENARIITKNYAAITRIVRKAGKDETGRIEEKIFIPPAEAYGELVKVYQEMVSRERCNIFIRNYLPFSVTFDGSGVLASIPDGMKSRNLLVPANGSVMTYDIPIADTVFYFHEKSSDFAFSCPGLNYPSPKNYSSLRAVMKNYQMDVKKFTLKADSLILPDEWMIAQPVFIPSGYKVVALPGCRIFIQPGAFIYAESPFIFKGLPGREILIESGKESGNGIAIVSQSSSVFEYTRIINQSNPVYKTWSLPASVNICGGYAILKDCEINSSKPDGLLYVLHSKAILNRCKFLSSTGFAIRADFSDLKAGLIIFNLPEAIAITAKNSGADIDSCHFQANAIAIDASINSHINIGFSSFITCRNAVRSGNGSLVSINRCSFRDCEKTLFAGNNLAIYPPSLVVVTRSKFAGSDVPYLITGESYINIDGEILKTTEKKR